ncbi:UNVERIFIED_CONTAM: pre-mRNA-splicing factor prp46, partial [Siphonaria sp. JEL0065]
LSAAVVVEGARDFEQIELVPFLQRIFPSSFLRAVTSLLSFVSLKIKCKNVSGSTAQPTPLKVLVEHSVASTHAVFLANYSIAPEDDAKSQRIKLASKILDEWAHVRELPVVVEAQLATAAKDAKEKKGNTSSPLNILTIATETAATAAAPKSAVGALIDNIRAGSSVSTTANGTVALKSKLGLPKLENVGQESATARTHQRNTGHLGWVRSIAVDPGNEWFATGAGDRTIADVKTQEADPQIITASSDSTIKLWDFAALKSTCTLTNPKKSVRALAINPNEYTFASASTDNIKQWKCPRGEFIQNLAGHNAVVNTLAINQDNVCFSGGDNRS